jgi:membrane protein YdbS with pleckstrin-like domain
VHHGRVGGVIAIAAVGPTTLTGALLVAALVEMPLVWRVIIPGAVLAVVVGLAVLLWRWPALQHRRTAYRVDAAGIEIRSGVWWRRVVNVPRSRIQHTDVSQGPLERNFGLSTLGVFTAGTEHSKVELHGLARETALEIRDHLLAGGGDDAV